MDHFQLRCTGLAYCDFNPVLVCNGDTVLAQPLDERVDITVLAGVLDASCQMVDEGDPQEEEADPYLLAV